MSDIPDPQQYQDEVKLLQTKNKSLSDQLDKITADLFKMQDTAAELRNQLEEKKHTEQLAGWAIDRALETHKLAGPTSEQVTQTAQKFCDWIKASSAAPVKE